MLRFSFYWGVSPADGAGRAGTIESGAETDRGAGRGSGVDPEGGGEGLGGAGDSAAGAALAAAGSGGRGGSAVIMLTGGIEAAEGKS